MERILGCAAGDSRHGTSHLSGPGPGPRTPDEVTRATVSYNSDTCRVESDGDHVSVIFNGLTLGMFAAISDSPHTRARMLRQEAVAKTERQMAYIYKAGLKGFARSRATPSWSGATMRRCGSSMTFGGDVNEQPVDLQARNRLEILDAGAGSLAIFPPPHKFFFARENEVNLGYVYYRKDNDTSFSWA